MMHGNLSFTLLRRVNQSSLAWMQRKQACNGVVVTDTDGLVIWVNRGFQLMTGYSVDEALGRKPGTFLQGEQTDPQTIAHMSDRLSKGQGFDT